MLNDATSNEFPYVEDWLLYYAQRRNIIQRFAQCAAGAIILALFFAIVPDATQASHPAIMNVLGAIGALFLLATAFQ